MDWLVRSFFLVFLSIYLQCGYILTTRKGKRKEKRVERERERERTSSSTMLWSNLLPFLVPIFIDVLARQHGFTLVPPVHNRLATAVDESIPKLSYS